MLKFFFALFILVPLAELYLLIEVGSGIGGFSTIALCLLTAALGGILVRHQ
ncbi:FxsA family protein, partial [Pseudomonadota bacterium]